MCNISGHGWPETKYDADADEFRVTRRAKVRIAVWLTAWALAAGAVVGWWLA